MCGVRRLSRRLYWVWWGRSGKHPGNSWPIVPKNLRSDTIPVIASAAASATISSSLTFPTGPGRASRNVVANTYAAIVRVSSEAHISCSNHEVAGLETLFLCQPHTPAPPLNVRADLVERQATFAVLMRARRRG